MCGLPEARGNLITQTLGIRDKFNLSGGAGLLGLREEGARGLDSWVLEEKGVELVLNCEHLPHSG